MAVERQPIQEMSVPSERIDGRIVAVPHPKTLGFLKEVTALNSHSLINEKTRTIIFLYYLSPGMKLKDLVSVAGVGRTPKVWEIIESGMERLWETLPAHLQEKHPKEEIIKRKQVSYSLENQRLMSSIPRDRTHSEETKRKIGNSIRGKPRSAETKRAVSKGLRELWKKRGAQRKKEKIIAEFKEPVSTEEDTQNIWRAAIEENLIGPIINNNFLTKGEMDEIKGYFEGGKKPPEKLLDKLSIAVAKTA